MPRLILWDIDGTLLRGGRVGAEIFGRAIESTMGTRPRHDVLMSGKTDPQIVREYLAQLDVADADIHMPDILVRLEAEMAAGAHLLRTHGVLLPGVTELLERLAADDDVDQSVVTGNIAPNAMVKLAAFGLERWLDLEIGAYGSDHADRAELVPIALGRARAVRGRSYAPQEVWVVGDSANDLACARAAGVRCLLVATGRPSFGELEALGPDALRHDLGQVDDILELLRS